MQLSDSRVRDIYAKIVQSYKKKCTFANIYTEKVQIFALFHEIVRFCSFLQYVTETIYNLYPEPYFF